MRQKTRIFIYILIAIAVVIMGTLAILGNHNADTAVSAQEHIDLGRIYLVELSYEKAVLEFTEAIEIEPLNADAYLGLAETYAGMSDIEKAIDVLEEGYEKTGDERLKDMLEELQPHEETTVTTVIAADEVATSSTVKMVTVPDLSGLSEEQAIAACEAAGLKYNISYDYSDDIEKGYVVSQVIPMNTSVVEGRSVPFIVSEGVEVVTTIATTTEAASIPTEEFITIKGIQYSTSLTELDLSGKNLTDDDIKDLYKIKNLEILELGSDYYVFHNYTEQNKISDMSVLKTLTNLKHLDLGGNQISDISALKNLTNLTTLKLGGNQISDISALSNLTNLEILDLWHNEISDISALRNLTNLEMLNLSFNHQINDISALKNLTNLIYLNSSNNQISNISALKNLTNLTYLYLVNDLHLDTNKISDISALSNLTNLEILALDGNEISDISALRNLTNLETLQLLDNQISYEDKENLIKALPDCKIIF